MRGQAYTLEATIAAVLLVTSLIFALQVTAVTPLSASTSSQHIENQQRSSTAGALVAASEATVDDGNSTLKAGVLFWNDTAETFHDAERIDYYTNRNPENEFGDILDRSFSGRGLAVNVFVHYTNERGDRVRQRMVFQGAPSDNAISASRTVTLLEDDVLYEPDGSGGAAATNRNLTSVEEEFYAPNVGSGKVYNVVRVEVVVWRM